MSNTDIYNRLHSASPYHPASVELFDDFALEAGDVITVVKGSNSYILPIFRKELNWTGTSVVTLESSGNRERAGLPALERREYANESQQYQYQQNLVTRVNTLVADAIQTISLDAVYARIEEIEADYVVASDIAAERAYVNNFFTGNTVAQQMYITQLKNVNFQVGVYDGTVTNYHRFAPAYLSMGSVSANNMILVESDASGNTSNINLAHYHTITAAESSSSPGQINITLGAVASTEQTANFNIADTQFYANRLSAIQTSLSVTPTLRSISNDNNDEEYRGYLTLTVTGSDGLGNPISKTDQSHYISLQDFYDDVHQSGVDWSDITVSVLNGGWSAGTYYTPDNGDSYYIPVTATASATDGSSSKTGTGNKAIEVTQVYSDGFNSGLAAGGLDYERAKWRLISTTDSFNTADLTIAITDGYLYHINGQWGARATSRKFKATDEVRNIYGMVTVDIPFDNQEMQTIAEAYGYYNSTKLLYVADEDYVYIDSRQYPTTHDLQLVGASNNGHYTVTATARLRYQGNGGVMYTIYTDTESISEDDIYEAGYADGVSDANGGASYTINSTLSGSSYISLVRSGSVQNLDSLISNGYYVSYDSAVTFLSNTQITVTATGGSGQATIATAEKSINVSEDAKKLFQYGYDCGFAATPNTLAWHTTPQQDTNYGVDGFDYGSGSGLTQNVYIQIRARAKQTGGNTTRYLPPSNDYTQIINVSPVYRTGYSDGDADGYARGIAAQGTLANSITGIAAGTPSYSGRGSSATAYLPITASALATWGEQEAPASDDQNVTVSGIYRKGYSEGYEDGEAQNDYGTLYNSITQLTAKSYEVLTTGASGTAKIYVYAKARAYDNLREKIVETATDGNALTGTAVNGLYRAGYEDGTRASDYAPLTVTLGTPTQGTPTYSNEGPSGTARIPLNISASGATANGALTDDDSTTYSVNADGVYQRGYSKGLAAAPGYSAYDLYVYTTNWSLDSSTGKANVTIYAYLYGDNASGGGSTNIGFTIHNDDQYSSSFTNTILNNTSVTKIERIYDSGGYQYYVTYKFGGTTKRVQVNNVVTS